jgi:hypothetical protein
MVGLIARDVTIRDPMRLRAARAAKPAKPSAPFSPSAPRGIAVTRRICAAL